jgi:hypothetical protein
MHFSHTCAYYALTHFITDLKSVMLKCTMSWTSALDFHYAWQHSVCGIQHPVLTWFLPTSFHECITKQERQCMYKCDTEVHSRNYCCCGKAISIIYYECVPSHSYPACKAHALYYTYSVIFGLSDCTTLSHIRHNFLKKLLNIRVCFDFCYNFVWNISHSKKKSARYYHKCT